MHLRTRFYGLLMAVILCLPGLSFAQIIDNEARADRLLRKGQTGEALHLYEKAFNKDDTNEQLALKLARTNFEVGRIPEAYIHYSGVINKRYLVQSLDYLHYAQVLIALDKTDGATKWIKTYLKYDPINITAQNLLIKLNFKAEDLIPAAEISTL